MPFFGFEMKSRRHLNGLIHFQCSISLFCRFKSVVDVLFAITEHYDMYTHTILNHSTANDECVGCFFFVGFCFNFLQAIQICAIISRNILKNITSPNMNSIFIQIQSICCSGLHHSSAQFSPENTQNIL